jgi:hypothetical protein
MTGFIRGIFSRKKSDDSTPAPQKPKRESKAYFLNPDDAKTFGNIDYMRTAKSVKKTFPKGKVSGEYTKAVSAMESMNFDQKATPQPVKKDRPVESTPAKPAAESNFKFREEIVQRRRQSDNSMDMFRNMARDIKKK